MTCSQSNHIKKYINTRFLAIKMFYELLHVFSFFDYQVATLSEWDICSDNNLFCEVAFTFPPSDVRTYTN